MALPPPRGGLFADLRRGREVEPEGDEDHLSPRDTIRALLALHPILVKELLNDREERNKQ